MRYRFYPLLRRISANRPTKRFRVGNPCGGLVFRSSRAPRGLYRPCVWPLRTERRSSIKFAKRIERTTEIVRGQPRLWNHNRRNDTDVSYHPPTNTPHRKLHLPVRVILHERLINIGKLRNFHPSRAAARSSTAAFPFKGLVSN